MINRLKRKISSMKTKKGTTNNPLLKYLKPFPAINLIDVGAHKGLFSSNLIKQIKIDKGVLIEPIPENFEYLRESFSSGVYRIFNNAADEKDGETLQFNINNYDETSSLLRIKSELDELSGININLNRQIDVQTRSIDSICREVDLNVVHLMKIDVQGSELSVLKGAKETLKRTKFIWVETSFKALYDDSALFNQVYDLMTDSNFIMIEISPGHRDSRTGELLQADLLFKNRL
jgi:FkbM family methyltransferase